MMKLFLPGTNNFHNFKCGEIFCLTSSTYNVACCLCGFKVSFEEFREHFQQKHLLNQTITDSTIKDIYGNDLPTTIDENDQFISLLQEDPLKNEVECIGSSDTGIEDEKPIEIDYISRNSIDDLLEEPLNEVNEFGEKSNKVDAVPDWSNNSLQSNDSDGEETIMNNKQLAIFPCNKCDKKYKSKKSLYHHLRNQHNPKKKEELKKEYKCEECGEILRSERNYRGHMRKHTGIFCDICGKPFAQVGNLAIHKIRHTGVKEHKCKECGNEFYTLKELRAHMLRHTQIMPIICEICGKPCRDRGVLTAHMRRHTGERPAKCEVCGKAFYCGHDLNVHAVTHTTERPFACDVCGATFQRKKALRVHKKLHSSERNHVCKICGKAFVQSSGLSAHMRTHDAASKTYTIDIHSTHK